MLATLLLVASLHFHVGPHEQSYRTEVERLRAVDLRGRARLCRDVAARCLEGAARYGRLDARLRREAAGWIYQMYREMRR